jgi:hypothetical protein
MKKDIKKLTIKEITVTIKSPENIDFTPSESEITKYMADLSAVRPSIKTKKGFRRMTDKQFANYLRNYLAIP